MDIHRFYAQANTQILRYDSRLLYEDRPEPTDVLVWAFETMKR